MQRRWPCQQQQSWSIVSIIRRTVSSECCVHEMWRKSNWIAMSVCLSICLPPQIQLQTKTTPSPLPIIIDWRKARKSKPPPPPSAPTTASPLWSIWFPISISINYCPPEITQQEKKKEKKEEEVNGEHEWAANNNNLGREGKTNRLNRATADAAAVPVVSRIDV